MLISIHATNIIRHGLSGYNENESVFLLVRCNKKEKKGGGGGEVFPRSSRSHDSHLKVVVLALSSAEECA